MTKDAEADVFGETSLGGILLAGEIESSMSGIFVRSSTAVSSSFGSFDRSVSVDPVGIASVMISSSAIWS